MQGAKPWVILECGLLHTTVEGVEKRTMELLLVSVLALMLITVAYAQWQRGVVRTVGKLSLEEDETDQTVR